MSVKPPSTSNGNAETVILKAPLFGTAPDVFDADKTVIRPIATAKPFTPKPKGYSISFDHPETNEQATTGKTPSVRELQAASASSDLWLERKSGAATSALPAEAAPAKGGALKWILGGAAVIVVFVLGMAYLIGSDEMAETKVTVLKHGTLIEPAKTTPTTGSPANVPVVVPEPAAAPQPVAPPQPPPEPAPAPQVQPQAQPSFAAAPAPNAANAPATAPGPSRAATAPKAPPDAAAVAAASARKAAQEKERLSRLAQTNTPVVTQAPPSAVPTPAPAPEAAPTPAQIAPSTAAVAPLAPVAPSSPNQACEGRWLLAKQNCLTEQCAKPAFTNHPECVERRAMDQRRQEQQRNR